MPGEGEIVPRGQALPLTQEEGSPRILRLGAAGSGWQLWSYPVELEPPFRPFFHH